MTGATLLTLGRHQCRYPVGGEGEQTRFCAAEVSPDAWRPGRVGGSYCAKHRAATHGRGTESEASAHRSLEALG